MSTQTVLIDSIVIPEIRSNAVYSPEKWAEFVESIRAGGIQFRPSCRQLPDMTIELVDGLHRLKAWKELGHTDIEVDVDVLTDEQAATKHLVANHQRGESDPIGLSKVIKKLREGGKTYAEIGSIVGYSETTIRGYERLCMLPDIFQTALTQGKLNITHIKEAYRMEDDNDVAAALAYSIQLGWSAAILRQWVNNRIAEVQQASNSDFTPGQVLQPAPPPDPNLVQFRQCLCCGAHGKAEEMVWWTLGKECQDALKYLKSIDKNPFTACEKIVQQQDALIKELSEKEAQLKELSQKFIDLSLRLMPAMQPLTPAGQIPGTGSSALPRMP